MKYSQHILLVFLVTISMICMYYNRYLSSLALSFFTFPLSPEQNHKTKYNQDEEIENLRKKLALKQFEIVTLREKLDSIEILQKDVPLEEMHIIIPANILIKKDTSNNRNSFVIDRGSNDKVRLGSLVVYKNHLLGIVYKLSSSSSVVLQITDPYVRIPVSLMVPKNQDYEFYDNGICVGYNRECKIKLLQNKTSQERLQNGVAVTSGFAKEYPKGLIIGETQIQGYGDSFVVNVFPLKLDEIYHVLVFSMKKE